MAEDNERYETYMADFVKKVDVEAKKDIEEAESLAEIVGAMICRRNSLGISQRELAI